MAATGDEAASIAQAAKALDVDTQNSGATGDESVRLRQLKMLRDSGAGGKKYKIEAGGLPTQVQSSASAGDVVITAAGDGVVSYLVLELTEDESLGKTISQSYRSDSSASIDDLPQVVQDALANIPQTMAPPPTDPGYSWFIMPPCDVYLTVY